MDLSQDLSQGPALPITFLRPWRITDLNPARDFKTLAPFSDNKGGQCFIDKNKRNHVETDAKRIENFASNHAELSVAKCFKPLGCNVTLLEREQSD